MSDLAVAFLMAILGVLVIMLFVNLFTLFTLRDINRFIFSDVFVGSLRNSDCDRSEQSKEKYAYCARARSLSGVKDKILLDDTLLKVKCEHPGEERQGYINGYIDGRTRAVRIVDEELEAAFREYRWPMSQADGC